MKPYIKIPLTILSLTATFALAIAAVLVGGYYYVAPSLPQAADLRDIKIQVPLQVYSRDGRLLAEFGEMKRTPVAYENIPPLVIKAVLAAEDEHFFEHPGVDYRGVLRGIVNELRPGGSTVGGSTITQQVTRTLNVFQRSGLSSGLQRFVQKFKEWILAFRIEREFTKEEILQLYLNTNFFGQRYYGVATAARAYFGKDLSELTVAETALLAGIPNRPSDFNPVASPQDTAAQLAFGHDHFHGVGRGAEDAADFRHGFDGVEDVDGKHVAQKNDEGVSGGQVHGVFTGQVDQFVIRSGKAHQADIGGLAKGQAEFGPRHGIDDGLVQIFDGFDKMGVA